MASPTEKKSATFTEKQYIVQDSCLTSLMKTNNHVRGTHNLVLSMAIIGLIGNITRYIISPDDLFHDFSFWQWAFSGFSTAATLWLQLHLGALIMWLSIPIFDGRKTLFTFWYISFLAFILVWPARHILHNNYTAPMKQAITMEQTRIMMKIHSFVVERVYKRSEVKGHNVGSLLYFMFAPCIIYRPAYPRTEKVNVKKAICWLLQFFLALFTIQVVLFEFISRNFTNAGVEPLHIKQFAFVITCGCFVGAVVLFAGWYAFLHCWANFWAEILRFADRKFYEDWWTSENYVRHFRKWNVIVHDWLHQYIYVPLLKSSKRRAVASFFTFLLSAVFHEYILTAALGYFYPLLAVMFIGIGLVAFYITATIHVNFTAFNVFLFISHFLGYSLMITFFAMEWYARKNCRPLYNNLFWDRLYPITFSCVTLNY